MDKIATDEIFRIVQDVQFYHLCDIDSLRVFNEYPFEKNKITLLSASYNLIISVYICFTRNKLYCSNFVQRRHIWSRGMKSDGRDHSTPPPRIQYIDLMLKIAYYELYMTKIILIDLKHYRTSTVWNEKKNNIYINIYYLLSLQILPPTMKIRCVTCVKNMGCW